MVNGSVVVLGRVDSSTIRMEQQIEVRKCTCLYDMTTEMHQGRAAAGRILPKSFKWIVSPLLPSFIRFDQHNPLVTMLPKMSRAVLIQSNISLSLSL